MFSVSERTETGFAKTILTDKRNGTKVVILPDCGGILQSWYVQHNGREINLIEGYDSEADWRENVEKKGFRSSKLSPFVCRLHNGEYEHGNLTHKIKEGFYQGPHALHGLLYNVPFFTDEIYVGDDCARLRIGYSYRGTDMGFPFRYDCFVTYELRANNQLRIQTHIINNDAGAIPMMDGWHPYFQLHQPIDNCMLQIKAGSAIEMNADLIPTGKFVPDSRFKNFQQIGNTHLDHCFLLDAHATPPQVSVKSTDGLQINIYPESSYPFLVVYTPPSRQSIAIENVSGAPDAFNNNLGLLTMPMGSEKFFVTTYEAVVS